MAKKPSKTRRLTTAAFREVHEKQPKRVTLTIGTYGKERGEKQRIAIALDKARQKGARIPKKK